jgi:hypothetical protein
MRLALVFLIGSIALAGDPPLVRSIEFADFKQVTAAEILDRLNEREVRLTIQRPYRLEDAEEARRYIAELLAEKGSPGGRIEISTRRAGPGSVEVRFRLLKR